MFSDLVQGKGLSVGEGCIAGSKHDRRESSCGHIVLNGAKSQQTEYLAYHYILDRQAGTAEACPNCWLNR